MSTLAAPAAATGEGVAAGQEPDDVERTVVLWLTNVSHALNHFQNQMVSVLYPVIVADLGFGYLELGTMSAARNFLGSGTQVVYGFLTPFIRRSRLLGIGNLLLGLGTLLTGFVSSFSGFFAARVFAAAGASAQHPVGSSLLAGYFPRNRGSVLALNTSIAGIGSLLAPLLAAGLVTIMGWRQVFMLVAILSVAMGTAYFFFRDTAHPSNRATATGRQRLAAGKASYLRVARSRNMLVVSLIMMAGAAGRGDGVNTIYLGPHFVNDLGLALGLAAAALTALQLGSIAGPVFFGWLSDRLSRKAVIQASLLLSGLATLWVANLGGQIAVLLFSMVVYGSVVSSRNTLTQALIADSLADEDRDAGFSMYYFLGFISGPIWALLTGFLMDTYGFNLAFSVLAGSYLAGMVLVYFLEDPRPADLGVARD